MTRPPLTVILAGVLAVAGIVASLWRPVAPPVPALALTPATTGPAAGGRLDRLSPLTEAAVSAYRSPRLVVAILAIVLTVLVPLAFLVTRPGRRWIDRVARIGHRPAGALTFVRGAALAASISAAMSLAVLPLGVWSGIVHDGQWGLRTSSALLWWRDRVVSTTIEVLLIAAVGGVVAVVVARRARSWHGDLVLAGVLATAMLTVVWPVLVQPLLVPTSPLDDPQVQTAIDELVTTDGGRALRVEVADVSSRTSRVNAHVVGLGPTRRIVLDDTLLQQPIEEVRAVIGHELAHDRHRDVERAVLAGGLGLLLVFWLVRWVWSMDRVRRFVGANGSTDVRIIAVGMAVTSVLVVVGQPVALWQSRRVESAADHAALEIGVEPDTVIALHRRLATENLQPMESSWLRRFLFGTHPDPGERIRRAAALLGDDSS